MKTFLFLIVEGGGNVPAQIAVARRLAKRGHAVHVLADQTVAREAASAGATFHPFVHAPTHNLRDRHADTMRDWEPASPLAQLRRVGEHLMFGPAAAYARDLLDAVTRVRPDAVAVDCLAFGGMIGAEKSGVPTAVLLHFPFHSLRAGVTPPGLGLHPARGPAGWFRDRVLNAAMRRLFRFGLVPGQPCASGPGSGSARRRVRPDGSARAFPDPHVARVRLRADVALGSRPLRGTATGRSGLA